MNQQLLDEIEAFEWEAEETARKIKDIMSGKVDIKKMQELDRIKEERKLKESELKRRKEEEKKRIEDERLRNGNEGKGEKDNYLKLCKRCFIEYEIDLDKCTHCGRDLMKKEDRHKELKAKVEELKVSKAKKKFRKAKYENWMKTEAIFKTSKINFANYQKWDLYESSSDEDEKKEPILPRHDPNFLALEKDVMDSHKAREASRNKALKLKDEGNEALKQNKPRKAIRLYSEAIEEFKGMMLLYTNRAMAYIKVEELEV